MNEQPTPYTPPRRRSRITVVKGAPVAPVTLSPLIDGMVTGTLGNVTLTSAVYVQLATAHRVDRPLAWVRFDGTVEVLGLFDQRPVRTTADSEGLPQLILTGGAR
ncbi:hypothetical protein QFZ79_000534 [Arthrobacter sp. V4I6]|uniref:hypothetical protein n=1 Tax=unclassified Arthrobacter TaxID=235627 RepID=UPI002783CD26|nr:MULTISPECIES: hypothetical protein [unclassified Arthrobacter]MDQ0822794.1 hypothetical protein [Arthrobacter sp. V1I7]MDQ0852423.1 hypothetical protein [Arthrobacter sp. V4I6]